MESWHRNTPLICPEHLRSGDSPGMSSWLRAVCWPPPFPCLSTHKPLNLIIHSRVLSKLNFHFEVRSLGKFGHLPFSSLWALFFPIVPQNYQLWLRNFICICLNSLGLSFFCVRRHKSIYSSLWLSADPLSYLCLQSLLTRCVLTFLHSLYCPLTWPHQTQAVRLIPFYSLWAKINWKP